jgi:hypothetical protein
MRKFNNQSIGWMIIICLATGHTLYLAIGFLTHMRDQRYAIPGMLPLDFAYLLMMTVIFGSIVRSIRSRIYSR